MLTLFGKYYMSQDAHKEYIYIYISPPEMELDRQNAFCRILIAPICHFEVQIFGIDIEQAYLLARQYIEIVLEKYVLHTDFHKPISNFEILPRHLNELLEVLNADSDT